MRAVQNSLVAATLLAAVVALASCSDSGSAPGPSELTLVGSYTEPAGIAVASSGDGFLVVYGGSAAAPGAGSPDAAILGVRVATDGKVLDASSFRIADASDDQSIVDSSWSSPAVAFDGGSYVVAYAGDGTAEGGIPVSAIVANAVDADANVGAPNALVVTAGIGMCRSTVGPPPAVAASPTAPIATLWPLHLACAGGPMIDRLGGAFATRSGSTLGDVVSIDDLLPPIDPDPVQTSAPAVAANASATVAAWTQSSVITGDTSVVAAILSESGVERVTLATEGVDLSRPAIASDGDAFLVLWTTPAGAIQAARFQPGVAPPDGPAGFTVADGPVSGGKQVAFGGGRYLVVWTLDSEDGIALVSAEVSPAGEVGPASTLATGLASNEAVVAAADDVFLVPFLRSVGGGATSLRALLVDR